MATSQDAVILGGGPPLPAPHQPATTQARPNLEIPSEVPKKCPSPLKDALNSAIDRSPVANAQLDPELVRQVTEQVIKNLQAANIAPKVSPLTHSPPQSPVPHPLEAAQITSSPPKIPRAPQPYVSSPTTSESSDQLGPRQRRSNTSELTQADETPVFRHAFAPTDEPEVGFRTPTARAPSLSRDANPRGPQSRPRRSSRSVAPEDATTLEKIWTPLFDVAGNPTLRLGQFLRGVALHLINNYEPKASIVVTPGKMLRFFSEAFASDEHFPWADIFGGAMSNPSLSVMYRKLLCQHHLVQTRLHELPNVPGLTPAGFECFLTCLIQAHPDTEFSRLARVVMNMPISNFDDHSERFPKELSRRLLPIQPIPQAEQRLVSSLAHEPGILGKLKNIRSIPPPPPPGPSQQVSFNERERMPYAGSVSSMVPDEVESGHLSQPIERERKPYTAKEGAGKIYAPDGGRRESLASSTTVSGTSGRPSRTNQGPPISYTNSSVDHVPGVRSSSTSRHRTSTPNLPPSLVNATTTRTGRRSPPLRQSTYTKSAPIDVGAIPPSQFTSNLHFAGSTPITQEPSSRDDEHYSPPRRRASRRGTTERFPELSQSFDDEEMNRGRAYPIPPRPPPSMSTFDPATIANAGPLPSGSYHDARRRNTWFGQEPPPGSGRPV